MAEDQPECFGPGAVHKEITDVIIFCFEPPQLVATHSAYIQWNVQYIQALSLKTPLKSLPRASQPGTEGSAGHLSFQSEKERLYKELEWGKSDSEPTKRKHSYLRQSEQRSGAKTVTRFSGILTAKTSPAQLQLAAAAPEMTLGGKVKA